MYPGYQDPLNGVAITMMIKMDRESDVWKLTLVVHRHVRGTD